MSPQVLAGVVVLVSIGAWLAFIAYTTLGTRREKELEAAIPVPEKEEALVGATAVAGAPDYVREVAPELRRPRPVQEDVTGMTRRQFLNRSWLGGLLVFLAQFGLVSIDFLWPRLRGGFGAKITLPGDAEETRTRLAESRTPEFIADGRFFIAALEADPKRVGEIEAYKLANATDTGLVAIYRKCVHLGCSVPWCAPAKWFECPCHGSKYSINGEYRDGPAPRGLDRFPVEIVGGKIVVDTGKIIQGPPRGTFSSQPQPEGEHCVEA